MSGTLGSTSDNLYTGIFLIFFYEQNVEAGFWFSLSVLKTATEAILSPPTNCSQMVKDLDSGAEFQGWGVPEGTMDNFFPFFLTLWHSVMLINFYMWFVGDNWPQKCMLTIVRANVTTPYQFACIVWPLYESSYTTCCFLDCGQFPRSSSQHCSVIHWTVLHCKASYFSLFVVADSL